MYNAYELQMAGSLEHCTCCRSQQETALYNLADMTEKSLHEWKCHDGPGGHQHVHSQVQQALCGRPHQPLCTHDYVLACCRCTCLQ